MLQVESLATSYKAEWIDLSKRREKITPPRSGHVSFTTNQGDLYVFGGYVEEKEENGDAITRYVKNDLWKWSSNQGWIPQKNSDAPNPRLASACAILRNKPTLFGGWDPQTPGTGGIILDDIVQLEDGSQWNTLENIKLPDGPTSRHVAVALHDDCVLLHTHRCTNHVLVVTTVNEKGSGVSIKKQATTGDAPSPRGLHAATLISKNKLLITCGAAQDRTMSNEVFVLDTSIWEWTRVEMTNAAPCPRASPCLCTVQDGVAVLFGGAKRKNGGLEGCSDVWLLSMNDESCRSGKWELLIENGAAPGRNAATMNRIPAPSSHKKNDGDYFLLQGGWEPFQKTYNDNYVLRVYKE